MKHNGGVRLSLLGTIAMAGLLAGLSPAHAQFTNCKTWNLNGEWTLVQSNETLPVFTIRQSKTFHLSGNAYHSGAGSFVNGQFEGKLDGNAVEFTAYWDNGTVGVYSGIITEQGRLKGTTYDANHPSTTANWYSTEKAGCLLSPLTGNKQQPQDKSTIKAQKRLKTGRPKSTLTICEAAKKAAQRNSPAAPGLKASCLAAGGNETTLETTE